MNRMRAFVVVVCALAPSLALAQDPEEEEEVARLVHEVRLDLDVSIANQANGALFDAFYIFTPQGIGLRGQVIPSLRRFTEAPISFYAHAQRNGFTFEPRTSGHVGGTLYFLASRLVAAAEAGVELVTVEHDPVEDGYITAPFTIEVGGRPLPRLEVRALYRGRPVIDSTRGDIIIADERSGYEHEIGGSIAAAAPTQRYHGIVGASYHRADWEFTGTHSGPLDVEGIRGFAVLAMQTSRAFHVQLRADASYEHWDNGKLFENLPGRVEDRPLEQDVFNASGVVEISYWYLQRVGLKFGLGGGFLGETPVVNGANRGLVKVSFGVTWRF